MSNKSQNILDMIRARQALETTPNVNPQGSPTTEDWKRFKETMIESVDGEPIKKGTGKTNKEFFKYLKEDIDDDECKSRTLRDFLKNLEDY